MNKAQSTNEIIGTMTGARGVQFVFTLKGGGKRTVTLDFYGNGANLNGATYARIESVALGAVVRAGFEVDSSPHFISA